MNLEERIARLERSNRLLGAALGALVLVAAVVVLGGAASDRRITADHIDAHSITVLSPDGKNRVDIYASSDGFAGIGLAGLDGKATATMMVLPSGVPSLCLTDKTTCRVVLGDVSGARNGSGLAIPSIQTRNAAGEAVWTAPAK
jgi:hypothetical protein